MADERVSAIPSELIGWGAWAQGADADLEASARRLNAALEQLYASCDPSLLPPSDRQYVGNGLLAYAVRNLATDGWVGRVGQAFLAAAERGAVQNLLTPEVRAAVLNQSVTCGQREIAHLVGGDPAQAGVVAAAAATLAARVTEAERAGATQTVRSLLQQLSGYEHDPLFTSAFFRQLGVKGTVGAAAAVGSAGSESRLLSVLDTALATATRSQGWEKSFNAALWSGRSQPPAAASISLGQLLLLKFGVYSRDFLTRAADEALFPVPNVLGAEAALKALARNPEVAAAYLRSQAPGPPFDTPRLLRIFTEDGRWLGQPQLSQALSQALTAAGSSLVHVGGPTEMKQLLDQVNASLSVPLSGLALAQLATWVHALAQIHATRAGEDQLITGMDEQWREVGQIEQQLERMGVPSKDLQEVGQELPGMLEQIQRSRLAMTQLMTGIDRDYLVDLGVPEGSLADLLNRGTAPLAVLGDILTLIDPGSHLSATQATLDRVAAGANLTGMGLAALSEDVAGDLVPEVGVGMAVVSGLYAAYESIPQLHDLVDGVLHIPDDVWQQIDGGYHQFLNWLSGDGFLGGT